MTKSTLLTLITIIIISVILSFANDSCEKNKRKAITKEIVYNPPPELPNFKSWVEDSMPRKYHYCDWASCPYRDVSEHLWVDTVTKFVGVDSTAGWWLDMLHLRNTNKSYAQLKEMLYEQQTNAWYYK